MTYASSIIAAGLVIQMYGIINSSGAFAISGSIIYIIGLVVSQKQEDKLNDRIERLEKEIKEMKSNDQRHSM